MRVLLALVFSFLAVAVYSQTCPRCTPLCQNGDGSVKTCGDDGCGSSCGTCASGQSCCHGACVCTPNCVGRVCGDDGCGFQSCGRCSSTQTCSGGVCLGTAQAECAGRVCGDNRAGGSCGSCPAGQRCRSGQCECYYDCEERNCGTAAQPEGTNTGLCPQRSCGTCPSGFTCGTTGRCSQATPCNVLISVVDCDTRASLTVSASVSITWSTSVSYSGSVSVAAGGVGNWTTPGIGTFTFTSSATGYVSNTETQSVTSTTTALTVCVRKGSIQIDVRDRATDQSITGTSTDVQYSGQGNGRFTWDRLTTFTHQGYGNYNFVATPSAGYGQGNTQTTISASTTLVIIYVDANPVQIDVREQGSSVSVNFAVAITYSGKGSGSISWNGLYTWRHQGYGTYTFTATASAANYKVTTQTETVSAATTLIIIYLVKDTFCGDGICNGAEKYSTCQRDCAAVLLEMENADGSGPVTNTVVYYYSQNPREANAQTGPNEKANVTPDKSRTASSGSNIVSDDTYTLNSIVYVKAVATNFITFYWAANTSDPLSTSSGIWRLRVHLAGQLQSSNKNYRFVNTWKPIDATPTPYGPTDLNLHLFHPKGACDINNPKLIDSATGQEIGNSVADSKQSGGPATVDMSPGAGTLIAVWNTKPPRDFIVAPSQTGRYLKDSGSYVVIYGKTSNAGLGKQLGEVVLIDYLKANPSEQSNTSADLWYIADVTISSPGMDQPTIAPRNTLDVAQITGNNDMIFNCRAYAYCSSFKVPYSDSSK